MIEHEDPKVTEDLAADAADEVTGGLPTHHLRKVDAAVEAATASASTRSAKPLIAHVQKVGSDELGV